MSCGRPCGRPWTASTRWASSPRFSARSEGVGFFCAHLLNGARVSCSRTRFSTTPSLSCRPAQHAVPSRARMAPTDSTAYRFGHAAPCVLSSEPTEPRIAASRPQLSTGHPGQENLPCWGFAPPTFPARPAPVADPLSLPGTTSVTLLPDLPIPRSCLGQTPDTPRHGTWSLSNSTSLRQEHDPRVLPAQSSERTPAPATANGRIG